jgi:hypothetical protein
MERGADMNHLGAAIALFALCGCNIETSLKLPSIGSVLEPPLLLIWVDGTTRDPTQNGCVPGTNAVSPSPESRFFAARGSAVVPAPRFYFSVSDVEFEEVLAAIPAPRERFTIHVAEQEGGCEGNSVHIEDPRSWRVTFLFDGTTACFATTQELMTGSLDETCVGDRIMSASEWQEKLEVPDP